MPPNEQLMLLRGISGQFDLLKRESKPNRLEVWKFLLSSAPHPRPFTLSLQAYPMKAPLEQKQSLKKSVCSSYRHQIADSWLQLNANVDDKATFFTAC